MRQKCRSMLNIGLAVIMFSIPASLAVAGEDTAWTGSASLGLSLTSGNSETFGVNGAVTAERTGEKSKLILGAQGNYAQSEINGADETTTDDAKAYAQFNRNITDRLYWLVGSSIEGDSIADIYYRFMVGPGLGAYLIKNDKVGLSVDVGGSYIREELTNGLEDDFAALRVAQRFEYKLTEKARIWQAAEYLANFEDFEAYLLNAEVGVEAALKGALSLRVVLLDKYDNVPAPGLEENDISLITSLVYKF